MANNTFKSSIVGKAGTETITNFATIGDTSTALVGASISSSGAIGGTAITGSGQVQGATVRATSYFRVGNKYVFSGVLDTAASIVAAATAITATPIGSMYLGKGRVWVYASNSAASICSKIA